MMFEFREWMEDAECTTATDPEIFFPNGDISKLHMKVAQTYCDRCMVAAECLQYAVSNFIDEGIFAGTTPTERRRLRRKTA
jgi:WhiB family redox-sensing transcriptional regulator